MYSFHSFLIIGMLLRLVGLKECGLGTHSLGLDWPLSEVGTGLEQQICSSPHHLIIWACLPGPETENKQQQHTHKIFITAVYKYHQDNDNLLHGTLQNMASINPSGVNPPQNQMNHTSCSQQKNSQVLQVLEIIEI